MLHRDAENRIGYPSEISSLEASSESGCISGYAPSVVSENLQRNRIGVWHRNTRCLFDVNALPFRYVLE